MLRAIEGIEDLSVTTNGYLLERDAAALVEAGIDRINVSIDSLARDRFFEITRRDALPQVLRGLEAVAAFPEIRPIKVNAVAIRDFTEDEVLRFAEFARTSEFQIRFIEFMPLDADRAWTADQVLTGAEVRALIERRYPLEPLEREPSATARVYRFADGDGRDRIHQPGFRTVLRRLQPDQADRRRQAADLPLLDPRDKPPRGPSRRRRRRGGRSRDPRCGLAQGAQAPRRRARLPPAAADDERDRRLRMDAREWIAAFAAEAGAEAPSDEQIDQILKLAAVAAHSSERIAAPVACWIAGTMGIPLERAKEIAEAVGVDTA